MDAIDKHVGTDPLLSISFAGKEFFLDGREGADLVARQMSQGSYEAPLPMLLMAIISRTSGSFVDIGANNGIYSILACKTRPSIRVAAFEPYPPVAEVLRKNLSVNTIDAQVDVYPIALSNTSGTVAMYIPDPNHGLLETSASLESDFKPYAKTVEVDRKMLDDMREIGPISVMKLDIEGHEAECLYGARHRIAQDRPFIFAEMLPGAAKKFDDLSQQLERLNYAFFRLRTQSVVGCRTIRYDPQAWNYGLVPYDRLPLFKECCDYHGLEMLRLYYDN